MKGDKFCAEGTSSDGLLRLDSTSSLLNCFQTSETATQPKEKAMRAILLTIFLGCSLMHATAATTYDLVQGFSTNNNPSSVWSYGYLTSTNGGFSLYPTNY